MKLVILKDHVTVSRVSAYFLLSERALVNHFVALSHSYSEVVTAFASSVPSLTPWALLRDWSSQDESAESHLQALIIPTPSSQGLVIEELWLSSVQSPIFSQNFLFILWNVVIHIILMFFMNEGKPTVSGQLIWSMMEEVFFLIN